MLCVSACNTGASASSMRGALQRLRRLKQQDKKDRKAQRQDCEGHSRVISSLSAFKEEEGLMERSYQPPEG